MSKKLGKRVYNSLVSILGAISLFFLGLVLISFAWDLISNHLTLVILGIVGIIFLLMFIGALSFKKIKKKVIDIFT